MSAKGVVAAGHPLTVNAAAEVLRSGGNAFDAAIAAFFMACAVEPVLASLGGGGFLLARDSSGRSKLFDFFTQTPKSRAAVSSGRLDFYPVMVDFGSAQQEFHVGLGACAVPGCVRGMFDVHRSLGRVPMRVLVQPAMDVARRGVVTNSLQAYIFELVEPIYMTDSARSLFASQQQPGRIAKQGDILQFSQLADTMEVLAIEGDDFFYRGEIAQSVDRLCGHGVGYLRRADFEDYRTVQRDPLCTHYRQAKLLTNPPPSAGGALVAFGLRLLEQLDVVALRADSYEYLRLLTEVMLQTSFARMACLGAGSEASDIGADQLLDESFIESFRREVLDRQRALRGTTHVSIMDAHGNVASMTVSNGEGCGTLIPETGIMLNNMLGEEDVNPGGFHLWQPAQRMSSMMTPTLAILPSGRTIATGSGGSNRIRTALLQVLINLIDFGLDLETAVQAPRIHIEEEVLNIEGGNQADVIKRLVDEFPRTRVFDSLNLFFGGAHTVIRQADGSLSGAGDPRRGGVSELVK